MRAAQRLGKQLQRLRTRRGLTQEQLAVNVGLSRTFVTRLELGHYDPTLNTLVRLVSMTACHCSADILRSEASRVMPAQLTNTLMGP